jgi:OPT family oligopeptide transporter
LYWTGALTGEATKNILSFLLFTTAVGFFGMFYAVPMRKSAIIHQKLTFPSGTSTAFLIKSLHEGASGAVEGIKKTKAMLGSFVGSMLFTILVHFVPIVANWYIPAYCAEKSSSCADAAILGWFIILSPLQIGAGLIMGFNAASSLLLGTVLAWGIIGPTLYHTGVVSRLRHFTVNEPGADYFLIWTAIAISVVGAFADLAAQYQMFIDGWFACTGKIKKIYRRYIRKSEHEDVPMIDDDTSEAGNKDLDPVPENEQVPFWVWFGGFILSCALTMIILQLYFGISWYESLLANFLGCLLSVVTIQSAGRTDVNPIGMVGKLTQFIFAAINPNIGVNLWTASVSSSAAGQSVDMLQDLKTGHILGASPRGQLIAQGVGTFFGIFASVFGFVLFAEAYPCILQDPETPGYSCPFAMPSVYAWYGLALGLTTGFKEALPPGSLWSVLAGALLAIILTLMKYHLPEKYSKYVPNAVALGIGFLTPSIIPQSIMFFLGALIALAWDKFSPATCALYLAVVSAGMIGGEGVGGITNAVIVVAGVEGTFCGGLPEGYC